MDENTYTNPVSPQPEPPAPAKKFPWKIAAVVGGALVLVVLLVLLSATLFGSSKTTPLQVMEKTLNTKEIAMEAFVKDFLGGIEGNQTAKLVKLLRTSDDFKDQFEEIEEAIAETYEDNVDKYGKNFKVRYKNEKDYEVKLDRDELKSYKSEFKEMGDRFAELGKALGKVKGSDLKDLADDLDMNVKDLKAAIDCIKEIGSKLKGCEVTEGYDLEYLVTITGSELDEPEEEDGELTVLKVNGKWVSTEGLSLLSSIYYMLSRAVSKYI